MWHPQPISEASATKLNALPRRRGPQRRPAGRFCLVTARFGSSAKALTWSVTLAAGLMRRTIATLAAAATLLVPASARAADAWQAGGQQLVYEINRARRAPAPLAPALGV